MNNIKVTITHEDAQQEAALLARWSAEGGASIERVLQPGQRITAYVSASAAVAVTICPADYTPPVVVSPAFDDVE